MSKVKTKVTKKTGGLRSSQEEEMVKEEMIKEEIVKDNTPIPEAYKKIGKNKKYDREGLFNSVVNGMLAGYCCKSDIENILYPTDGKSIQYRALFLKGANEMTDLLIDS